MDEIDVILRAQRLACELTQEEIALPLEAYLRVLRDVPDDIVLRIDRSLANNEAGHTVLIAGKRYIVVNGNDREERQRFTACHELAHIVLGLPTEHENGGTQFARRSRNETLCDEFAAEVLLPRHLFRPLVHESDTGFTAIERLAGDFTASLVATGSRFAAVCDNPCSFVLIKNGVVRYASRSKRLRECGGWIRPGQRVPDASFAAQLARSQPINGPIEIAAEEWFEDWKRGGVLLEDARHSPRWNQTVSLLWFEDDVVPTLSTGRYADEEDYADAALQPLDGVLPWPGKSRRR